MVHYTKFVYEIINYCRKFHILVVTFSFIYCHKSSQNILWPYMIYRNIGISIVFLVLNKNNFLERKQINKKFKYDYLEYFSAFDIVKLMEDIYLKLIWFFWICLFSLILNLCNDKQHSSIFQSDQGTFYIDATFD